MIDFIEYYKIQNHIFGECMSHKDSDLMYVYIPKNASSWTKPNLLDWGWEFYNYHTDNLYHKHGLIVLRDPIERWLSGIAEYLYLKHRDLDIDKVSDDFLHLLFDRIAFDDHTDLQVLFLQNLNLENCTFFWCDKQYREKFSSFLNTYNMNNRYFNYEYQHVTNESSIRKKFKDFFKNLLTENKELKNKIENYFSKDYNLINRVKFK